MANENPIKKLEKRNKDEIKNILETLKLTENINNQFKDKYKIFLSFDQNSRPCNKFIEGYIIDNKIYDTQRGYNNYNFRLIEFLFVTLEFKFYILQTCITIIDLGNNRECFHYGYREKLDLSLKILENWEMTEENRCTSYFDPEIVIEAVNNLSVIFDLENFISEKTIGNMILLGIIEQFNNDENTEIRQGEYLLYQYNKYIMNEISIFRNA